MNVSVATHVEAGTFYRLHYANENSDSPFTTAFNTEGDAREQADDNVRHGLVPPTRLERVTIVVEQLDYADGGITPS